ncbi:MAG TPA: ImmA/IrrE family metallo-endopeptidase [Leptolyngbyaceae cyanobacterium]
MTQAQMDMTTLYQRLSALGLPEAYVKKVALPDWWDAEFEQTGGAVVEAAAYISKRLNLDFDSLFREDTLPTFDRSYKAKFKVRQGTDSEQLSLAHALAIRIAEMLAYACPATYQQIAGLTAQDIRAATVRPGQPVSLGSLLRWCWDRGIPVVHFNNYPNQPGICKFHGMAVYCHSRESGSSSSRPVIVISHQQCSPSRLLFILAHELGHLLKGHIAPDSFLIDEKVELFSDDQEETEANEFAVELLTGSPHTQYRASKSFNGEALAQYAQKKGIEDNVDPGVVANNYGWYAKQAGFDRWGAVANALKILEPDANAPIAINQYLNQQLNWDRLSDDNQEYLEAALNLEAGDGV